MNWRDNFTKDVLKQSESYMDSIENVDVRGNEINANLRKSSHFHVYIDVDSHYMSCTCRKNNYCKHQAAVLKYVEENDLINKEKDFLNIMSEVDVNNLKNYFIEVLSENPDLKEDFLIKFKKEPKIDATKYFNKLNRIIRRAEGNDYYNFNIRDIKPLANGIFNFLVDEVRDLLNSRQYEVVFELLDQIAGVLNNKLYVDDFSWYDACEEYLQIAYRLEDTYVLSDEQLEKLEKNTSFMHRYM